MPRTHAPSDSFSGVLGARRGRDSTPAAVVGAFLAGEAASCATLRSVYVSDRHVFPQRHQPRCYLLDAHGRLLARGVVDGEGPPRDLLGRRQAEPLLHAAGAWAFTGKRWSHQRMLRELALDGTERRALNNTCLFGDLDDLVEVIAADVSDLEVQCLLLSGKVGWLDAQRICGVYGHQDTDAAQKAAERLVRMGLLKEVERGCGTWQVTQDGAILRARGTEPDPFAQHPTFPL